MIIALLGGLSSCNRSSTSDTLPPLTISSAAGKYISSYSSTLISRRDDLLIRFAQPVIDDEQVGTKASSKIWEIRPGTPLTGTWQDRYTLALRPDVTLEGHDRYRLTVHLDELYDDVPEALQSVDLEYRLREMKLSLDLDPVRMIRISGAQEVQLSGTISSSDAVSVDELKPLLQISQKPSSDLRIEWNEISPESHTFSISGIKRFDQSSQVRITYDGKSLDPDWKGRRDITILSKDLLAVQSITESDGSITVTFSDILSPDQDLDGLITVDGYDGDLDISVDGNIATVHASKPLPQDFTVRVDKRIIGSSDAKMNGDYQLTLSSALAPPAVRLIGKGAIVPGQDRVIFPFETINLQSVTVEIFKVYQDNVLQHLQSAGISDSYQYATVGKVIYREQLDLPMIDRSLARSWQRQTLDLASMISLDPGSIYQVTIGFEAADALETSCEALPDSRIAAMAGESGMESMRNLYIDYAHYDKRDDPCHYNYYNSSRFVTRSVLASNMGVIAKMDADHDVLMVVTDLRSVEPLPSVEVMYYDFQQQPMGSSVTDGKGMSRMELDRPASFAILRYDGEYGYVRLLDAQALSLSEFDVGGATIRSGINGYLYAERGVHRPGDTIFLEFMLENARDKLPSDHPVSLELRDSRGRVQYTRSSTAHLGGIYPFIVPTEVSDPTGNWSATVKVGSHSFQKTLKVETVKPNRLKITYPDIDKITLHTSSTLQLSSEWLTGASAGGLSAKVDMTLTPITTSFDGYDGYVFDDPARESRSQQVTVFDDKLGENGEATFQPKVSANYQPAGRVKAGFRTKVSEKGGNFSEDYFAVPADPYEHYAGIKIPASRWGRPYIQRAKATALQLVSVDTEGRAAPSRELTVGIYEAQWRWWYDRNSRSMYRYNSVQHRGAVKTDEITTGPDGTVDYQVLLQDYGMYLVRVCDEESGHCSGQLFYTGYGSRGSTSDGPQLLSFEEIEDSYAPGDDLQVTIPTTEGSKIFISIENGTEVIDSYWQPSRGDKTDLKITVDREMTPNAYAHIHVVQPHNDGTNDLALRMYGVLPFTVIDPDTRLEPVLDLPDKFTPNDNYTVTISEDDGKEMYYTLAVVDEGLLDLTRFATPDPWSHFYAKEALGVRTWDIYDEVLDGYGGSLDRYISVGGDGEIARVEQGRQANRFTPTVKHIGPYHLAAGASRTHDLAMGNYVGSVRVMAVARHESQYGSTDAAVKVTQPLMVLATLPRNLAPGESLQLPANVFALDDKIKDVIVSASTSDALSLQGSRQETLAFSRKGDQQAYFQLQVPDQLGMAEVTLRAEGHGESAEDRVEIDVVNPMPYTSEVSQQTIKPGESWQDEFSYFGLPGTQGAVLELSQLPPMNLEKRLSYLIRYPYGCLEQTISGAMPQLYLAALTELSPAQQADVKSHVIAGINRMQRFRHSSGGFAYWPGQQSASDWATSYAGHFLLSAKSEGYLVDNGMLQDWQAHQRRKARSWRLDGADKPYVRSRQYLMQSYRLYTLALAGAPEIGAMNRLRLSKPDGTSSVILAAAYALIGQEDAAEALLDDSSFEVKDYQSSRYTYGSAERDRAMMLSALVHLSAADDAATVAVALAERLGEKRWYSTHSSAWMLTALGRYVRKYGSDDMSFQLAVQGDAAQSLQPSGAVYQYRFDPGESPEFSVQNSSEAMLFARLIRTGQRPPDPDMEPSTSHLAMKMRYLDEQGQVIDVSNLRQGQDFIVETTVSNPGTRQYEVDNVALKQVFPSGWEIINERLSDSESSLKDSAHDHKEIRDDRVYTFFSIAKGRPKKFYTRLNASYAGRFFQPPVICEAMYDHQIKAQTSSGWVIVRAVK